jgi:phospho-N-acetylmuramoyl-pentapeptide-transferase
MLYHLFEWFNKEDINFPGSELYRFITFRVLIAILLSLLIATVYGKKLIRLLQKRQIGESVRDLGLAGEHLKKGTPTMGGIIIILAIIIPTLLLARLDTVYVVLMLIATVWLGIIGFVDDYIKIFTLGDTKVTVYKAAGLIQAKTIMLSTDKGRIKLTKNEIGRLFNK